MTSAARNEGIHQTPCTAVMWAWWDAEKSEYRHLYPSELCVRMCSPDRYKRYEAEGRGKVMQVRVTPTAESHGLATEGRR
jgi:hypothetical protein